MITAVVNTPIYIPFTLLDSTGAAETGKVNADFTNDIYLTSSPGTTATGVVTEVSEGRYLITFTPTASGLWHVAWDVVVDGDTVEFEEIVNAQASTVVTVVSASAAGSLTQTLAQLRRRVARELQDYASLTCTANGTTTTIVDTQRIRAATETMVGRVVVSTNGTNNGLQRVVDSQVDSTGTLTVAALTASTATNDTFDVYNKRGKGFEPWQYDAAINDAINDAFPLHMIEQTETISTAFDADGPGTFTVPASFVYVHTVEYQDEGSYWISLPQAGRRNEYGWLADAAEGKIRILGRIGGAVDNQTIRVVGYGRQGTLSSDSDTCTIPAEWLVYKACASLCLGAIDKDQSYGPRVQIYENKANGLRTRVRTLRRTGSVKVRAA